MFDAFLENIAKWNVIVGLIIAIVGFVLMIAAKPITEKIFKNRDEQQRGNIMITFKVIAAVFVVLGCVLVIFINM